MYTARTRARETGLMLPPCVRDVGGNPIFFGGEPYSEGKREVISHRPKSIIRLFILFDVLYEYMFTTQSKLLLTLNYHCQDNTEIWHA